MGNVLQRFFTKAEGNNQPDEPPYVDYKDKVTE